MLHYRTDGLVQQKIAKLWPEVSGEVERFMRALEKATRTAMAGNRRFPSSYVTIMPHPILLHDTLKSPTELLYNRELTIELPTAGVLQRKCV